MDDAAWLELIRGHQPPFWKLLAESSSGGRFEDNGDVQAAIVPAAPDRSVFNSAFYRTAAGLESGLERLSAAYADSGVRAWTVWVPEADTDTARLLEEAGHVLDAEPRAMAAEISWLRPAPDSGAEVSCEPDVGALCRINDIAYGYPEGTFGAVITGPVPDTLVYIAKLDGEPVGCTMSWDRDGDCEITFVATLPEAQGRGIAKHLMTQALEDAAERGLRTTTLQASGAGRPAYERLGYRDFGALQMWERRA